MMKIPPLFQTPTAGLMCTTRAHEPRSRYFLRSISKGKKVTRLLGSFPSYESAVLKAQECFELEEAAGRG